MQQSADNESTQAGWRGLLHGECRRSLILVCLSVWLHASMVTAISTLVPAITSGIGGVPLVPWAFALYEVGSIIVGAGSGLLVFRYGLRTPLASAAGLFALGSVVGALAPTMPVLLVGRILQGLGGGGLIALSFVATSSLFPSHLLPRAMAVVSAIWGGSAFLGPLIGAFFAEQLDWRMAFWFFALLAASLALWIAYRLRGHDPDIEVTSPRKFPIRRITLLSLGVVLVAAGGIDVSLVKTPLFVSAGVFCLVWFLRIDSRSNTSRLLPGSVISLRNPVGAGLTMIMCFTVATIAITVYGPLFMVRIHGVSILTAGYIVACSSVGWSLGAMAISGIQEEHDGRAILAGMSILTISIVGFVFTITTGPLYLLALFALLEGVGFGIAWASVLRRLLQVVDADDRERVSAAMPTVQRLGYALGAAWIGIIANAVGIEEGQFEVAARWVFAASLPMALIGLVAALRFTTNRHSS